MRTAAPEACSRATEDAHRHPIERAGEHLHGARATPMPVLIESSSSVLSVSRSTRTRMDQQEPLLLVVMKLLRQKCPRPMCSDARE